MEYCIPIDLESADKFPDPLTGGVAAAAAFPAAGISTSATDIVYPETDGEPLKAPRSMTR